MSIVQRRYVQDRQGRQREISWEVDLDVLEESQEWAGDRDRVQLELEAMAEMYPAWTLLLSANNQPLARPGCADVAVPTQGAWRWASDGEPVNIIRGPELALPMPPGRLGPACDFVGSVRNRIHHGMGAVCRLGDAAVSGIAGVRGSHAACGGIHIFFL